MNDCTPPRAILLNRAYNAITRDDYTPESIQAAIERLFDATRTAALEEAAVIADGLIVRSKERLDDSDYPDSSYSQYLDGIITGEEVAARTIRAAKDGAQ